MRGCSTSSVKSIKTGIVSIYTALGSIGPLSNSLPTCYAGFFRENETAVVTHTAYPFPVVMANIPDRALKVYSRSHIFRCDEADYKEFIAEEITPKQYQIWHRKEVQEFL